MTYALDLKKMRLLDWGFCLLTAIVLPAISNAETTAVVKFRGVTVVSSEDNRAVISRNSDGRRIASTEEPLEEVAYFDHESGVISLLTGRINLQTGKLDAAGNKVVAELQLSSAVTLQASRVNQQLVVKRKISGRELRCTYQSNDNSSFSSDPRTAAAKLQLGLVRFAAVGSRVVAMELLAEQNGTHSAAIIRALTDATCHWRPPVTLASDRYVELGASPAGGYWAVGAVVGNLLVSVDGERWQRIQGPEGARAFSGAFIESPDRIWLAAASEHVRSDDTLLFLTTDGGVTWRPVELRRGDIYAGDSHVTLPETWYLGKLRVAEALSIGK